MGRFWHRPCVEDIDLSDLPEHLQHRPARLPGDEDWQPLALDEVRKVHIQKIVAVTTGQPNGTRYNNGHFIRLVTKDYCRHTIVPYISSRQEACWVVSQLETLAGLKIDTRVLVESPYGPPPQPGVNRTQGPQAHFVLLGSSRADNPPRQRSFRS